MAAEVAVLAALEQLDRAEGGRTGEMSTARGSEAVEFTRVELIATTARRLCCCCCVAATRGCCCCASVPRVAEVDDDGFRPNSKRSLARAPVLLWLLLTAAVGAAFTSSTAGACLLLRLFMKVNS